MRRLAVLFVLVIPIGVVLSIVSLSVFGDRLSVKSEHGVNSRPAVSSWEAAWLPLDLDSLTDGGKLALLAFKWERRLELWKQRDKRWHFIKSYPFTAFSGRLGPKLRQGDRQIPEGIYRIDFLNPNSRFHLSMRINYPNDFDRAMARREGRSGLGGDIFIHGKDVTIGCIPIGDRAIEELYTIVEGNGAYWNTRVIIAPYDLRRHPRAPRLDWIEWEEELYRQIRAALEAFAL